MVDLIYYLRFTQFRYLRPTSFPVSELKLYLLSDTLFKSLLLSNLRIINVKTTGIFNLDNRCNIHYCGILATFFSITYIFVYLPTTRSGY